jgi:hypothetical protein
MKTLNSFFTVIFLAILGIFFISSLTNAQKAKDLLTVIEVANISAFYDNVMLVDKDTARSADGDLNFAKKTGELILTLKVISIDDFNTLKINKSYVHTQIEGIGDEAYTAPKSNLQPHIIFFRKGNKAVFLSTFLEANTNQPIITISQMSGLASVVAQKL